jgi:DNA-nicking Smr family endonuclease
LFNIICEEKMNFGEILKKWESISGETTDQKKETDEWLSNNKLIDKDSGLKNHDRGETRQRLVRMNPDDILDIHGLTSDKAWILLDQFFNDARDKGFEKLRIIHGKGNRSAGDAVLKHTVRNFIEKCSFAGESGYEKAKHGGTGATWVLLKD